MNYAKLQSELIRDEGMRLTAYKDTRGFWTIGVGHLLGELPTWKGHTILEADAMRMLDFDIMAAEKVARSLVPLFDNLTDDQQRALVNMCFNRGHGNMAKSKRILPAILEASAGGSWRRVRAAMAGSEWAQQVGPRAERLAALFDPPEPGVGASSEGSA